jgi:hypothetical protein
MVWGVRKSMKSGDIAAEMVLRMAASYAIIDGVSDSYFVEQTEGVQKFNASIKTTMDRYVHVTDDSLTDAVRQFASVCAKTS